MSTQKQLILWQPTRCVPSSLENLRLGQPRRLLGLGITFKRRDPNVTPKRDLRGRVIQINLIYTTVVEPVIFQGVDTLLD